MTDYKKLIEKFIIRRGWKTWYNPNCWIHEKCVADSTRQDYTSYGMDLESAFVHEVENLPPFKPMGMSEISKALHQTQTEVLDYYFGESNENK